MSTSPTEPAPTRGRGRPRSQEAHEAILAATVELLAAEGILGTSMEAVAAKAGVAKTTVYRRWATKEELIVEAVTLIAPPGPPDDTGSFAGDLALLAREQIGRMSGTGVPLVAPRVIADSLGHPELHRLLNERLIEPVRSVLAALVRRAIERGEMRADTDVEIAVDVLHGVVIYNVLISGGQIHQLPDRAARLASLLLDAFAPV